MGSVTPYCTSTGRRYRVRYRVPDNSQTDKRGFKTTREAELFEGKTPSDFVFTSSEGGPIRNKNWRARRFEQALAKMIELILDLARLVPHDLRHTAASLAISAGAT